MTSITLLDSERRVKLAHSDLLLQLEYDFDTFNHSDGSLFRQAIAEATKVPLETFDVRFRNILSDGSGFRIVLEIYQPASVSNLDCIVGQGQDRCDPTFDALPELVDKVKSAISDRNPLLEPFFITLLTETDDNVVLPSSSKERSSEDYHEQVVVVPHQQTDTPSAIDDIDEDDILGGKAVVDLIPVPVMTISGGGFMCEGQNEAVPIVISLTHAHGPFNITIHDDNHPHYKVIHRTAKTNPYTEYVDSAGAWKLLTDEDMPRVLGKFDPDCHIDSPNRCKLKILQGVAKVEVHQTPTAKWSAENETIEEGQCGRLRIDLSGSPPWKIAYRQGMELMTIENITSSPFFVEACLLGSYELVSVQDSFCVGYPAPQAVVFRRPEIIVIIPPEARLLCQYRCCPGEAVQVVVEGDSPPFNFSWEVARPIGDSDSFHTQLMTGSMNASGSVLIDHMVSRHSYRLVSAVDDRSVAAEIDTPHLNWTKTASTPTISVQLDGLLVESSSVVLHVYIHGGFPPYSFELVDPDSKVLAVVETEESHWQTNISTKGQYIIQSPSDSYCGRVNDYTFNVQGYDLPHCRIRALRSIIWDATAWSEREDALLEVKCRGNLVPGPVKCNVQKPDDTIHQTEVIVKQPASSDGVFERFVSELVGVHVLTSCVDALGNYVEPRDSVLIEKGVLPFADLVAPDGPVCPTSVDADDDGSVDPHTHLVAKLSFNKIASLQYETRPSDAEPWQQHSLMHVHSQTVNIPVYSSGQYRLVEIRDTFDRPNKLLYGKQDAETIVFVKVLQQVTCHVIAPDTLCVSNPSLQDQHFSIVAAGDIPPATLTYSLDDRVVHDSASTSTQNGTVQWHIPIDGAGTYNFIRVDDGHKCPPAFCRKSFDIFNDPVGKLVLPEWVCPNHAIDGNIHFEGAAPFHAVVEAQAADGPVDSFEIANAQHTHKFSFNVGTSDQTVRLVSLVDRSGCLSATDRSHQPVVHRVGVHPLTQVSFVKNLDGYGCAGDDIEVRIDGGTPPYSFDLFVNNTFRRKVEHIEQRSFKLQTSVVNRPNALSHGVYRLDNILDGNGCSGVAGVELVVRPMPTARISGGGEICVGDTTQLSFNLTGNPPWQVQYTDGDQIFTVNDVMQSPFTIETQQGGNYRLVSIGDTYCTFKSKK